MLCLVFVLNISCLFVKGKENDHDKWKVRIQGKGKKSEKKREKRDGKLVRSSAVIQLTTRHRKEIN